MNGTRQCFCIFPCQQRHAEYQMRTCRISCCAKGMSTMGNCLGACRRCQQLPHPSFNAAAALVARVMYERYTFQGDLRYHCPPLLGGLEV